MYLERPDAEVEGTASGHDQPQWETTAIRTRATGQEADEETDEEADEEEEEKIPDAEMYAFLQPAQVRPAARANQHASTTQTQTAIFSCICTSRQTYCFFFSVLAHWATVDTYLFDRSQLSRLQAVVFVCHLVSHRSWTVVADICFHE